MRPWGQRPNAYKLLSIIPQPILLSMLSQMLIKISIGISLNHHSHGAISNYLAQHKEIISLHWFKFPLGNPTRTMLINVCKRVQLVVRCLRTLCSMNSWLLKHLWATKLNGWKFLACQTSMLTYKHLFSLNFENSLRIYGIFLAW